MIVAVANPVPALRSLLLSRPRRPASPFLLPGGPPHSAAAAIDLALRRGAAFTSSSSSSSSIALQTRWSSSGGANATPNNAPPDNRRHYDVLIVGGGAVGATLADRLSAAIAPSSSIGLLESRGSPPPLSSYFAPEKADGGTVGGAPNARAYALSPASLELINGTVGSAGNPEGDDGNNNGHPKNDGPVTRLDEMGRIAWYDSMQVWESNGPATLNFHSADLDSGVPDPYNDANKNGKAGEEAGRYDDVLGAVVEDGPLVSALWDAIRTRNAGGGAAAAAASRRTGGGASVNLICNASVRSIVAPSLTSNGLAPPLPVELTYETTGGGDGDPKTTRATTCTTNLLVAADGANSFVRKSLGMPAVGFGYGRRALTCTVRVKNTMGGMAYQRFMPDGPMALLPVWKEGDGGGRGDAYANIVWSTTPEHCAELQQLSTEEFVKELNGCMQSGPVNTRSIVPDSGGGLMSTLLSTSGPLSNLAYGVDALARGANDGLTMSHWSENRPFSVPPAVDTIVGPRLAFDLNLAQARSYVGPRVALVGDAAHTVHPMAGQGLNLGLGDVECLARTIGIAMRSGMDVGGTMHFLDAYDGERRAEVTAALGGIHALHTAFGMTCGPAVFVRSLGMNLVNAAGPVRRRLAEVAAGRRGAFTGLRC